MCLVPSLAALIRPSKWAPPHGGTFPPFWPKAQFVAVWETSMPLNVTLPLTVIGVAALRSREFDLAGTHMRDGEHSCRVCTCIDRYFLLRNSWSGDNRMAVDDPQPVLAWALSEVPVPPQEVVILLVFDRPARICSGMHDRDIAASPV